MKKLFLYILSAAGLLQLASCDKERLYPEPTNVVAADFAFDNPTRIIGQIRGMYASIKNAGMYGGRYQIFNDVRGGDFINERTNVVTGFDVWNYSPSNSSTNSVQNHWGRAYYVINLANIFLDGMAAGGSTIVGDSLSLDYQGEARFIRAMSYYSLLQLYARPYWDGNGTKPGVPLRLTGNTGSGDYALARSTVDEVYTQILADLNFAEQNLPLAYSNATLNTTRAHRNTAIAFKTRVYLSMQKYAEAITEANKIVGTAPPFAAATGVPHALQPAFGSLWTGASTTTENILSMPFSSVETPGTQNQLGYYYGPSAFNLGNGEYSLNPTGIIANTGWTANDARRTFTTVIGGKTWLTKYADKSGLFVDWAPVMRYSEVMLNLAEALARVNGLDARAIQLLNAVRQRSDAATTLAPATDAELIDAILTERRIELLGEGLAGTDLTRLGLPLPAKPGVTPADPSSQQYIWPISSSELLRNPLMTDN